MSFKDLVHGGSGRGRSGPAGPPSTTRMGPGGTSGGGSGSSHQEETRAVEGQVFKLASGLGQLKRLVDALGTPRDTVDLRHRISEANGSIQQLAKGIKERLVNLHHSEGDAAGEGRGAGASGFGSGFGSSASSSSKAATASSATPEQQAKTRKLLSDFTSILQDYKETQRICKDRESANLPKPSPPSQAQRMMTMVASQGGDGGRQQQVQSLIDLEGGDRDKELEREALLQEERRKQVAVMNNAIEFNEALIEERDQGIAEIARQIGEVNEMFQDLAVLVSDQGHQVQTIDDHIASTAERTREGVREVAKAEKTQRAYQNKCLWLWLFAAIVVSVVLMLLFA